MCFLIEILIITAFNEDSKAALYFVTKDLSLLAPVLVKKKSEWFSPSSFDRNPQNAHMHAENETQPKYVRLGNL